MDYYKKWLFEEEDFFNFYLAELNDGFEGLQITLKSERTESSEMEIFFTNYLSYRVIEESAFLKSLGEMKIFKFSRTESSEYLNWFVGESLNAFRDYKLTHYLIYASNKVIEIIGGAEPKVEIRSSN